MQEWPLEMFVESSAARGGSLAPLLLGMALLGALLFAVTRPTSPRDHARLGHLGSRRAARRSSMPVARRWAIMIAGGCGLLLGGAIGVHAGWLATLEGALIGAMIGVVSGYANPALSQSSDAD